MRALPLFRFGRRARSTSWGIALCTMFIVASFSVVGGLRNSMDALESNFEADYFVVTRPGPTGLDFFSELVVGGELSRCAFGVLTTADVVSSGESVNVFAVKDDNVGLPGLYPLSGNYMLAGVDAHEFGSITLADAGTVQGNITGTFQSPIFPTTWLLGSTSLLETLAGSNGLYNFAIALEVSSASAEKLSSEGFVVQPMIGIIGFLKSGITEIEDDVTWALLPSAFVIAVLAYSFIGTETSDKRREIGVVKTVGAGRYRVLAYLLADALIICAWGGLLGVALGIVLSYGIATLASTAFTSVLIVKAGEVLLLEAFAATVLSGLAGALIPAVRMTMSSPVKDLKEATPFS